MSGMNRHRGLSFHLENLAAWVLAVLWMLPLIYAFWSAFHPPPLFYRQLSLRQTVLARIHSFCAAFKMKLLTSVHADFTKISLYWPILSQAVDLE